MADAPRRFFVPPGTLRARNVTLSGDLAHRLARVLRLRRGDRVVLTDGGEREFEVELTDVAGPVKGLHGKWLWGSHMATRSQCASLTEITPADPLADYSRLA